MRTTVPMRALDDSRDGKLLIPAGADIIDVREPGWEGAEGVAKELQWTITQWTDHGTDPLFRKDTIGIADITQEAVGDCWYLAAMVAILAHPGGSDRLKQTMLDIGDDTVVVRLYDKNLQPHYLGVRKSILWHSGSGRVHVSGITQTGLWAAMLEKAACCMTKESEHGVCDPANPNYKNIEGGGSDAAFRMLLGVSSTKYQAGMVNLMGAQGAEEHLKVLFSGPFWNTRVGGNLDRQRRDALDAVFGFGRMSVDRWDYIMRELQKRGSSLVQEQVFLDRFPKDFVSDLWRLLMMPDVIGLQLPIDVFTRIHGYIRQHNIYSGFSGTGQYSAGVSLLFDNIRDKFNAKCPVAIGTLKDVGPIEGRGHSAGEKMSRGIVGNHAYAVLGVWEENVLQQRRKMVKLSNPWNTYGRSYSESGLVLTPEEQEAGAFWMELRDLGDVISNAYWTDAPPPRNCVTLI